MGAYPYLWTSAEIDLSSARTIQDVIARINEADVGVRATRANSYLMISDTTETPEDRQTALKIEDVSGFAARVFQHEFDHLDGILFVDHLSPLKRSMFRKKWKKIQEHLSEQM